MQPTQMAARIIHIVIATLIAIMGISITFAYPDLKKDTITTFGTISGFVTIYGVIFAAFEVVRARSAAQYAAELARGASQRVALLYELRGYSECQSSIEQAMTHIDNRQAASSVHLINIVKLYSSVFHSDYLDDKSEVRSRVAMLQSYNATQRKPNSEELQRLRVVLLEMMGHLSASGSAIITKDSAS